MIQPNPFPDKPDACAISVRDLYKCYQIYEKPSDRLKQALFPRVGRALGRRSGRYFREFWALQGVSFDVRPGETVGIIGRNGSGKSTLLQLICGTLAPTSGAIETNGRIAALLELGAGFNPEFSGRENVYMNAAVLGLSEAETAARYDSIVEFSELEAFIDQPVKTYSSGMYMRLAFAVQAHIDASIVIIDEALTVGDVFFRQKCYARLEQLRAAGAAILLVSHSMPDIEQYCERAILLDHGRMRFSGPAAEASKHYYLLNQAEVPAAAEDHADSAIASTAIARPPAKAFLDLTGRPQVGNGKARCTGVALCNAAGQACNTFRQGDKAVFFYEFELDDAIGIPICGLVIRNERGVIAHGKNNWQAEGAAPLPGRAGMKVSCRQEVQLTLGPGEYVFEVGLAQVSREMWENRLTTSHEAMSAGVGRICHVAVAGSFSVGYALRNGTAVLTHHGIADLPGSFEVTTSHT
jgi:lipopolysaccharide transport system ATP-binding protein